MVLAYPISHGISEYFTNYLLYNKDVDLNNNRHRNLIQYCNPYQVDWLLGHFDKVINIMLKDGVKSVMDFGCGIGGFAWLARNRFDEVISVDRTDVYQPLMDCFEVKLDFMCNQIQNPNFRIRKWDRDRKVDAMALIRFYPLETTNDKDIVKDYITKLKHYANTIYVLSIDTKSSRHLDKIGYRLNKYMWKI